MAKQVFTADVVTYDFLPEKYAKAQDLITAELTINVECDWQDAINNWYKGITGGEFVKEIDPKYQDKLTRAQDVIFANTVPSTETDWVSDGVGDGRFMVGGTREGFHPDQDDEAQIAVRQCLHHICMKANYWTEDGTGPDTKLDDQFASTLGALLNASFYKNKAKYKSNKAINPLNIDVVKVQSDLRISSAVDHTTPMDAISVSNRPTSKLRSLINGYAFVPVLNRLVAGGNFHKGDIDGDPDGDGDYSFDSAVTFDKEGNKILSDAQLVFPVKILVADSGETFLQKGRPGVPLAADDPSGKTRGLAFQLNIIFSSSVPDEEDSG